jgi:hypothetical protein
LPNAAVNRGTHQVDRGVINPNSTLGEQLFDVPVGQGVPQVPADRHGR